MKARLSVRIDADLLGVVRRLADLERRPISYEVEMMLEIALENMPEQRRLLIMGERKEC